MKKFVITYHAPAELMAQMATASPEQKAEGMKPWMAWKDKIGEDLIDFGAPLAGGLHLSSDGAVSTSTKEITGYSIIQATDMDTAKTILSTHPHLQWGPGCALEVHEFVAM